MDVFHTPTEHNCHHVRSATVAFQLLHCLPALQLTLLRRYLYAYGFI